MTKKFPKKRSKAQAKRNVKKKMTTSPESASEDDRDSESEGVQPENDVHSDDEVALDLGMCPTGEVKGFDEDDDASEKKFTRTLIMEHNRKKKKSGGFQSMGLSSAVFNAVLRKGYKIPTPIQRKTIPLLMDGKDVVAMARTGSGKTAAFLIPMFERLRTHVPSGVRAIIMSPTRELALQTLKFTKELGRFTKLKSAVILGGDRMEDQFAAIHENPDIVIATPGRFMHVLVEMGMKLSQVEYVVFDEADRLFEMGFQEQLMEVIKRLPDSRQTLLFSATLPKLLVEFAKAGLHDPTLIRLDVDTKLSEQLTMVFLECRTEEKMAILLYLLRTLIEPEQQTVIFVATKHHVEYLNMVLGQAGISCSCSYSSLDQTARKINVAKFRNKTTNVLVVTDLAARGIDIPMLDNVINFNFPAKPKLFVHRVGRVARAGRMGTAFSLVGPDEVPFVLDLHLFLGRQMNLVIPEKVYKEGLDVDALYGRVPWALVDEEEENLRTWGENTDLKNQKRVADNAYKHYMRSRPAPASESVKRVKELADVEIGYHPVFQKQQNLAETERLRLLDSMKHYRPPTTIFEVNKTNKSEAFSVMKQKRSRHSVAIQATLVRRQKRKADAISAANDTTLSDAQMSTESDMLGVFSTVVAPKRPCSDKVFQRKGSKKRGRDEENYVSYRPKDFNSEKGLSLGSSFEREVSGAMLDLTGDEEKTLRGMKNQLKWDRKKKKFVRESGRDEGKKKVKTESGTWISASYKSNLYKEWLEKNKVVDFGDDDEESGNHDYRSKFGRRGRGRGFGGHRGGQQRQNASKDDDQEDRGSTWGRGRGGRGRGGPGRGGIERGGLSRGGPGRGGPGRGGLSRGGPGRGGPGRGGLSRGGPGRGGGRGGRGGRPELKSTDQILKARQHKAKLQSFQKQQQDRRQKRKAHHMRGGKKQ